MAASSKKPTPYKKLSPAAKKTAKAMPGTKAKGQVGGRSGARSGRRPLG